ncbi:hypothetical protein [Holdemanella biformis]|uniref:hypothetical protein n=1 Tax=Holdemanella biformis TaxID=1735 RepID=UPI003AB208CE
MWVRSQDRKILTEIHDLDIDDINQIWDGSSLLGKYSTEEKALKVLDQIQYNMELFEHELTMVFQMPTDNEVDEV